MSSAPRRDCSRCSLAVLVALLACGGDATRPNKPVPAALELLSFPEVSGTAGESVSGLVTVQVTSSAGDGIPDIPVTFAPAANSGSVGQSPVFTGKDGIASVEWTLGTTSGDHLDTLRASIGELPGKSVVVVASVNAGSPETLRIVSGDEQNATPGTPLAQPLVVIAADQFGNPKPGVRVHWSVEGGGTLSDTASTTGDAGTASVTWTPGMGTNRVNVTATGVIQVLTFGASFTSTGAVTLTSIAPDALVEGQSATLTGSGFSTTLANDLVVVDGVQATITSASATSISITVPTFDCRPGRDVDVRVVVGGDNSTPLRQRLSPAAPLVALDVGQEMIVTDPASFCLQFEPNATTTSYLIGVQSTSEAVSSLTPVQVTAVNAAGVAAMVPASPVAEWSPFLSQGSALSPLTSERARRLARHREAEGRLRAWEHAHLDGRLRHDALRATSSRAMVSPLTVPTTVAVGDTIQIRVPDIHSDACTEFIPITTVVRAVGSRGVWLEDIANPVNGFSAADYQSLSALLDDPIYDTDVSYFGTPEDIDANGRIVVVISKEVNRFGGILGFVTSGDLLRQSECPASNEGEFFYGVTPDSAGTLTLGTYSRSQAMEDAPIIIAHEFSHIIQFEVRLARNASPMVSWTAEGQATLAEEVVGDAIERRTPGQNYGLGVAFNLDDQTSFDWYSDRFIDLATYFGFNNTTRLSRAPQECSWLAQHPANTGPCLGGRDIYGVPWSLLRWISDQYGPTFPGGEQGIQRALIDNDAIGYANLTSVIGVPIDTLLAQWAAMLYVDDRVAGADPKLTLPSWNLQNIYEGTFADRQLPATARLIPRLHPFSSFTDAFNVRGASAAYILLSGTSGPTATAVRVRNSADGPLPPIMQLFVVRTS